MTLHKEKFMFLCITQNQTLILTDFYQNQRHIETYREQDWRRGELGVAIASNGERLSVCLV